MMIYLDNAATTTIIPQVAERAFELYKSNFYNPSSSHLAGEAAKKILENARKDISIALKCNYHGIVFTSGATESSNTLIQGYIRHLEATGKAKDKEIIISAIEHSCIFNVANYYASKGIKIIYAPVYKNGLINEPQLMRLVNKNTVLVSVISVNNETGAIQDINKISKKIKKINPDVFFITDTVQHVGKLHFSLDLEYVDAFFISGHKFGAPKGIGMFYLNPNIRIFPLMLGGNQEQGYRSGTTNIEGACILAYAIKWVSNVIEDSMLKVQMLNQYLNYQLDQLPYNVTRIIPSSNSSPYIIALKINNINAKYLVNRLSEAGICISTQSACSSLSTKPSRIMVAMGLESIANNIIRVSLSPYNTENELNEFINSLKIILNEK